jgi:hypothetical protein
MFGNTIHKFKRTLTLTPKLHLVRYALQNRDLSWEPLPTSFGPLFILVPLWIFLAFRSLLFGLYVPSTSDDDDVKRATRRLRSLRPAGLVEIRSFIIKSYSVYLLSLYNINISQFITRYFSVYMETSSFVLYLRKHCSCGNLFQF